MLMGMFGGEAWDMLIVGAGPAGLSAAVNAKARNLRVMLFDIREPAGKVRTYPEITNYLGFSKATGAELANHFDQHLGKTGYQFKKERVLRIAQQDGGFIASTDRGEVYQSRTVTFCAGVAQTRILPGEEQYLGRGVSYCVTCDGALFRGKDVVVVGYVPEAEEEANAVADFTRNVTYVATYPELGILQESIRVVHAKPVKIEGNSRMRGLVTDEGQLKADGIFIIRAAIPTSTIFDNLQLANNFVCVNREMATNIPGVFAAGDCTGPPFQIAKAVGEGQVAALSAAHYIHVKKKES